MNDPIERLLDSIELMGMCEATSEKIKPPIWEVQNRRQWRRMFQPRHLFDRIWDTETWEWFKAIRD